MGYVAFSSDLSLACSFHWSQWKSQQGEPTESFCVHPVVYPFTNWQQKSAGKTS